MDINLYTDYVHLSLQVTDHNQTQLVKEILQSIYHLC